MAKADLIILLSEVFDRVDAAELSQCMVGTLTVGFQMKLLFSVNISVSASLLIVCG